jgi:hypothetical protein
MLLNFELQYSHITLSNSALPLHLTVDLSLSLSLFLPLSLFFILLSRLLSCIQHQLNAAGVDERVGG